MRVKRWQRTLIGAGWLAAALTGCKGFFGPRGVPEDPLLVNRQPIESKGQVTAFPGLTHREPAPPGELAKASLNGKP